jgi:hypothetical protein
VLHSAGSAARISISIGYIPVKVLALDFDIAHAIASLALTLLADRFLFRVTHGCCVWLWLLPVRVSADGWRSKEQLRFLLANFFSICGPPSGIACLSNIFRSRDLHHPRQQASSQHVRGPAKPTAIAMPPRLSLRAARAAPPPARCVHARQLSSTPAALALGPQSPNYIDVPKPKQPTFPLDPQLKGHLPIPRDIFKTRNPHPKDSEDFLRESTKDPKERKAPGPFSPDADLRLYNQRLADIRKESLREGVKELHARRVTSDAQHLARIQQSGEKRTRLAMAPRREVDTLTETSVSKGVRDFLADKLPTPEKNIEARRRAYERRIAAQQQTRESRLHDLYTNARTFIVSEDQLDAAIEDAFGTEENPLGWDSKGQVGLRTTGHHDGLSPWNGPMPEGVGDMMNKLRSGEGVGLAKERMKKLAEELTGGKL